MRFWSALAAATLLSAGLAAPALADPAGERLLADFIATVDASPGWRASAGTIRSEGATAIAEAVTLGSADGKLVVNVGRAALEDLSYAGGGISVPDFTLSDLSFTSDRWALTAPELTGKGLATPSLAGWSFDASAPVAALAALYTRLATTEFETIAIPSAAFAQTLPAPGAAPVRVAATYTGIEFGPLRNGVLAHQAIARIEQSTGPVPAAVTSLMEGIEGRNVSLAALARVFDPAAYADGKGDGQWLDAMESTVYTRIATETDGKETFSMGPVTVGPMQVRQTATPLAPALDRLIALADKPDDAALMALMENHLSDLIGWFRVTAVKFANMKGSPPDGGSVSLSGLSLENLSSEGLGRIALTDFAAEGPAFQASLKSFEIGDVVFPSIKGFMALARLEDSKKRGAPDAAAAQVAAESFLTLFPRIGRVALAGLVAGTPGMEPLHLESYEATFTGKYALLPEKATARLSSLKVPYGMLAATPESREVFDALGYRELVIHMNGDGSYDEATGSYQTSSRLSVDNAGALSLAYGLGGLTPERLKQALVPVFMANKGEPDPTLMMMAMGPITIDSFALRFEDASLTRRLLAYAARMQGMDEQTMIGNIAAMTQLGLSQLKQPDFTARTVGAITAFLMDPKSLTITLRPAHPVAVQQLMNLDPADPGAAIPLLGLTVTAND
jgi:hypothetical protein